MHRMLMIVNPRSGKELMKGRLLDTLNIFCAAHYLPEVYVTQKEGDGTIQAETLCPDAELIVCCGGDGTLNNVVTGMLKRDRIPMLGYIPGGSTNDFARSLKLPADVLKAAERIVNGSLFPIDVGKFGEDRYFAYIAAFGAFTEISYETPQDIKNLLGHQAYLIECIKHLPTLKSHHLRIEWEDHVLEEEFVFGMITNTISVGGFKGLVTRDVSLNDGLFEVLLIRTPRTLKNKMTFPWVMCGKW